MNDDVVFVPASELTTPITARDLLAELGVANATKAEQLVAVSEWLQVHRPSGLMRAGLKRLGLLK